MVKSNCKIRAVGHGPVIVFASWSIAFHRPRWRGPRRAPISSKLLLLRHLLLLFLSKQVWGEEHSHFKKKKRLNSRVKSNYTNRKSRIQQWKYILLDTNATIWFAAYLLSVSDTNSAQEKKYWQAVTCWVEEFIYVIPLGITKWEFFESCNPIPSSRLAFPESSASSLKCILTYC